MRKIAITGGKGGTGKSTVAVLLANKFIREGKKVILCDCDVECPNDYLLLSQKLKNPRERIYAEFPELNKEKCRKCGLCVRTCRSHAIFQTPGEYPVFLKDLCSGCGACWIVCPHGAINPKKEEIGQIYINKIKKNYWLVTGQAKPGLEETGPAVARTKESALNLAKKIKTDFISISESRFRNSRRGSGKLGVSPYRKTGSEATARNREVSGEHSAEQSEVYVLFDTAAGTHCPVISALLDCDLAYAITEPTPMGAYDLNLILDLCRKLKVKAKIILNQADLGDKARIQKIAKKYKIKIEKEIPYSKKIVGAYSKGKLLNFKL